MTDDTKTLYLIDGHAQFFRAYHAIRTRMTSPVTKEPTNLTYGFVGMILKLLRDYKPDHLAVVIDVSGDTESFRTLLYPEYKANREAPPEDFGPQVERCLSILKQMGVPVFGQEGVEADDVIATIVTRLATEQPDLNVRIISRDKDLTQLLRSGVELFDVHKDTGVTAADVFKTEGVEPRHVGDILALMGDTSDNIPGVPGIGPKTAAKLILEYGSIDGVYANIDSIKGKRRENLIAARGQVPLSRQLVELRTDLEVDFDLDRAVIVPATMPLDDLSATFRELDFNSHRNTLLALAGKAEPAAAAPKRAKPVADDPFDGGLFAAMAEPAPTAPPLAAYRAITTRDELATYVESIRAAGLCAVDTETDNIQPMRAGLCGVSFAIGPDEGVYIPVRSPAPETHLDLDTVVEMLRPVLSDPAITKIGQNIKYDLLVFRRHGIDVAGPLFDTMIASYVLDATRSSHGMNALSLAFLDHPCIPISDLIGKGKNQRTFDTAPLEQAVPYAAEDAVVTWRLRDIFAPKLAAEKLDTLFTETEMPLVRVLAELEFNGIHVDAEELERQRERLVKRAAELRALILDAAPHHFNPDSPRQLAAVLFNAEDDELAGLGLKVTKKGKTGPSTDQEVLEKLNQDPDVSTPIPGLILEHRQLAKLIGTYLGNLREAIHAETDRVHASFNQTVAATGRLSSSDPNLQNIPIRTETGREIRRAFTARPGYVLVAADYSQIELRILAHLSEDPALIEAFHSGADIHTSVAAETFGVALDEVTPAQRTTAKMINFGIVYGVTAFGLARRLGGEVSNREAQTIIDDYKARYHGIDTFLASCIRQAHEFGYVETMLGRRRLIPEVMASRQQDRAYGERMAINTVVQGSAADLIKVAMIDLYARLPEAFPDARMLLQIHDELVFEVPEQRGAELAVFAADRMSAAMNLRVSLDVKTACGASWYDA